MYKFSSTFDTTPYQPSNCSDKEQDEKVLDKITHCYLPVSKWQLPKKITNSPNTAFCIHLHSFDKRGHLVSLRVRPAALTQQNRCLSNRGKHFRRCCPPVLKSGAGLFFLFSSRQVAQLNLTAERKTHKALPYTWWDVRTAPSCSKCRQKKCSESNFQPLAAWTIDKCLLIPNSLHLCTKTIFIFFFPQPDYFTAGSLFPSLSCCTFLKACASTAEVPFQQPALLLQ